MGNRKQLCKIVLVFAVFGLLLAGTTWKTAYAETDKATNDIINVSGIMRDGSGNSIVQNTYVTREEFAQMLVQASPYAGSVKKTSRSVLFKDVSPNNNKAAYIQIAVTKGYMSGYTSGKFKPKKSLTLKEAIYGTLELLGYSEEDFAGGLATARYDKFNEVGLGKDLTCGEGDKISKSNCELLFFNLLNARNKAGDIYAKTLGYPLNEDGSISYQGLLEKKFKGPYIAKSGWEKVLTKKLTDYNISQDNQKIAPDAIKEYSVIYCNNQTNDMSVYDKKEYGSLDAITYINNKPQEFTVDGTNYTVEKPDDMLNLMKASNIKKGMMVALLLGRDDKVSYLLPIQSRVATAGWQGTIGFDIYQGTIYKDGTKITDNMVKDTDVIYYSKEISMAWVYSKKIYGVVTEISPSTATPQGVVVAGKTYELNALPINDSGNYDNSDDITISAWGKRLRENGINEGDNVVVLFGYNGNVADIRKVDVMPVKLAGYVIGVENKLVTDARNETKVKNIIRMVDTDGIIREFPCDDLTIAKESIVEVNFESSNPVVKKIDYYASKTTSDLPSKKLAQDVRIIEVNKANYTKIKAATLSKITWSDNNVLYSRLNAEGEISDLILYNVTDSFYQYGILKDIIAPNFSLGLQDFQFVLDIAGNETTVASDFPNWNFGIGPKAIRMENNKVTAMNDLLEVKFSYISGKQANTGSAVYQIADDVLLYYYKNGEYYLGSFDDITESTNITMYGYLENLQGSIRIIIIKQ